MHKLYLKWFITGLTNRPSEQLRSLCVRERGTVVLCIPDSEKENY
jgi:hypothetical protein